MKLLMEEEEEFLGSGKNECVGFKVGLSFALKGVFKGLWLEGSEWGRKSGRSWNLREIGRG